jgi:hypothetical protein
MHRLDVHHRLGVGFTASDGATELLRYTYTPETPQLESPKPFLHPLRTRSGHEVSLYRPHDHVWHTGLAWSLPVVGDENFWGGPTYVRDRGYVQLDNDGAQRHRRIVQFDAGEDGMRFAHELDWITQDGRRVFTEVRTLDVRLLPRGAWALVFDTAMTNVSGAAIALGSPTTRGRDNAGYGGLFWRGPRSFTGGVIVTPDGVGGDELRGRRSEWMAFAGRHDASDAGSVVLMLDATGNPQHPPQWFARSEEYAALNPAPFFSEELEVPAGESVRFVYGVGVADGGAEDAPALADAVRAVVAHRRA